VESLDIISLSVPSQKGEARGKARKMLKEEGDVVHMVQTRAQVVQQQEKEADEVFQQVHEDEP